MRGNCCIMDDCSLVGYSLQTSVPNPLNSHSLLSIPTHTSYYYSPILNAIKNGITTYFILLFLIPLTSITILIHTTTAIIKTIKTVTAHTHSQSTYTLSHTHTVSKHTHFPSAEYQLLARILHHIVLYCTALHLVTFIYSVVYCTVLHCTALHSTVQHRTALYCS